MDKTFEKIYEEYNKESAPGGNQALFEKVYAEAEMLNEMNPKLKALLAAGLIGTAGLGMQSCSNPSDSVYYPYTVEAPSTDNPGSGGGTVNPGDGGDAETSNPSGGEENGVNGVETVDENEVTFKKLGVNDTDANRIKNATSVEKISININALKKMMGNIYLYDDGKFKDVKNSNDLPSELPPQLVEYFTNNGGDYYYYIPANMLDDFIKAGAPKLAE